MTLAQFAQSESRKTTRTTISDRLEYRFIVGVVFTFSLGAELVQRALGKTTDQSIVAEAKSVAHTAAGYAFQR